MRHLYGIPNCSTVKKARAWLEARQIDYVFHDFKKEAPTAEWLAGCLQHVPLEILLNKRGTTWRKLTTSVGKHGQSWPKSSRCVPRK